MATCRVKNLGREIQRGAGNVGQPGFGRHTCAEIHQHDATTAFTHDVPCLDITVHEPGIVHGGQRATEVETDQLCLLRTEHAARAQFCIQGAAPDQFHPQAKAPIEPIRAVDVDDVGVTDTGKEARFLKDPRALGGVLFRSRREELQRHFAAQAVARAIDRSKRTAPDRLQNHERTPGSRGHSRRRLLSLVPGPYRHVVVRPPERPCQACHDAQFGHHRALERILRARFRRVPIDRLVVVDEGGQLDQPALVRIVDVHGPSPWQAARWHDGPPPGPPLASVCRAAPRLLRDSCPTHSARQSPVDLRV